MLTFATLYGTRRVGQPPIRWLESIEEDLRNIGVGIWKRMAMDRDKWRIITGAVKAGTWLWDQEDSYALRMCMQYIMLGDVCTLGRWLQRVK
jgi:hypothetical protein